MTSDTRHISGTIKALKCRSCEATVHIVTFEGESDVDTIGLCSAGSCRGLDVVIVEANPAEWNELAAKNTSTLQSRIAEELRRDDLYIVNILRIEDTNETLAATSFAEFRKAYRPPSIIYSCPCCSNGEAVETDELTVAAFKKMGGEVFAIGGISLA